MRKQFQPGNTYGAAGRPRGSKNRLSAQVIADMHQVWCEIIGTAKAAPPEERTTGLSALRTMAREKPADFAKMYAAILPRELDVSDTTLAEMSFEQIEAALAERMTALAALKDDEQPTRSAPGVH